MPLLGWRTNWIDSFGRTAGAVGANWTTGITTNSGETPTMPTIFTGGTGYAWVEGPSNTGATPIPVATMTWVNEVVEPDQYIEVEIADWFRTIGAPGGDVIVTRVEIYNHCGTVAAGQPRRVAAFQFRTIAAVGQVMVEAYTETGAGRTTATSVTYGPPYTTPTSNQKLRLESHIGGRQVVKLNGEIVIDYVEATTPAGLGNQQGMYLQWLAITSRQPPKIHYVQGGGDYGPVRLPFHGVIGEITIHDHALDDDEMLALLNYYDIQYASGQYH